MLDATGHARDEEQHVHAARRSRFHWGQYNFLRQCKTRCLTEVHASRMRDAMNVAGENLAVVVCGNVQNTGVLTFSSDISFLVSTLRASSAAWRAGKALSRPAWHSEAMALASSASLPILMASAFTCTSHALGLSLRFSKAKHVSLATVVKQAVPADKQLNAICTLHAIHTCRMNKTVRAGSDLFLLLISHTLILDNCNQQLLTAGLGLSYNHLLVLTYNLHPTKVKVMSA